jgi:GMP synthase-like glutamine amidotransferase
LGGTVAKAARSEVGVHTISVAAAVAENSVFRGLGGDHRVMQWHHAEVKSLPAGVDCLASSPAAEVQAIAVDHHAVGLQFHAEFTPQTVASWQSMPSYIKALEAVLGAGAYPRLLQESYPMLPEMGRLARRIYENLTARSRSRRVA